MGGVYCNLKEDEYSISYSSYDDFQVKNIKSNESGVQGVTNSISHTNEHLEKVEKDGFSNIDHMEKKTSIMANIATFLARISGL